MSRARAIEHVWLMRSLQGDTTIPAIRPCGKAEPACTRCLGSEHQAFIVPDLCAHSAMGILR